MQNFFGNWIEKTKFGMRALVKSLKRLWDNRDLRSRRLFQGQKVILEDCKCIELNKEFSKFSTVKGLKKILEYFLTVENCLLTEF